MTVDMQSLVATPLPGEGASIEEGRDSVEAVDCGTPAGLEAAIDQLSETLILLQTYAQNEHVQAVCGLLAKAQGELIKVSARDGIAPLGGQTETFVTEPLRTEEDLVEIESIPTASLLNRCSEVHAKKHVKDAGERCSSVSTASSLGGSAKTSLESSPRDTLPSPVFTTRYIAPARLSLPCHMRYEIRCMLAENRSESVEHITPAHQSNTLVRLAKLEVRREPISLDIQALSIGNKDNIESR
jgi:hypothetical protein